MANATYDWKVFDEETKAHARRLTCLELVRQHGLISERQAGKARALIRCPTPTHEDKNPSCSIRETSWNCFSCDAGGDVFDLIGVLDGIDSFVEQKIKALEYLEVDYEARRREFMERSRRLDAPRPRARNTPSPHGQPETPRRAPIASAPAPSHSPSPPAPHPEAHALWSKLLAPLTLSPVGEAFLKTRNLSRALARAYGLVSTTYVEWSERVLALTEEHGEEVVEACGLLTLKGRAHPYLEEMLVIPTWREGQVRGLRFRRLSQDTTYNSAKYLALRGASNQVQSPYLATSSGLPAACGIHQGILWIVEGALDALSLCSVGRAALGAPGAKTWQKQWVKGWRTISCVVILMENDAHDVDASRVFADSIREAAQEELGEQWVTQRLREYTVPPIQGSKDANDLLMISREVLEGALQQIEAELLSSRL